MTELSTPSPNPAHDTGELPGLTIEERSLLAKMFSDPLSIPPEWKAWLVSYLEANPPVLPISQIHGFTDFTAQRALVDAQQNTASATYTNLGTVGPQLSTLPKGKYLIIVSAMMKSSVAGSSAWYSPSVNGAAASDSDAANNSGANTVTAIGISVKDLDQDTNDITMKYRVDGGATGTYVHRNLVALKYANL